MASGALPQTPMGELTALPHTPLAVSIWGPAHKRAPPPPLLLNPASAAESAAVSSACRKEVFEIIREERVKRPFNDIPVQDWAVKFEK